MLTITDYLLILLLSSTGGFMSGFLGVGGGIIFIPILDFYLRKIGLEGGDSVKAILANSLFTIIFSGLFSSYKQFKLGNFFPKEIMYTASTGVISAVGMTAIIKAGTWYNAQLFSYVFAGMLFLITTRMFLSKPKQVIVETTIKPIKYSITGFFAGIITAMSGLGGGVVMTPVFTDWLKVDIRKASSISNGVIPVFAIAVGILNLSTPATVKVSDWQIGFIIFPVVLPMIISSIIFAPLGVSIAQKTPQKYIRVVFASFAMLILLKTLYTIYKDSL